MQPLEWVRQGPIKSSLQQLCHLGEVTYPYGDSLSSSIKWAQGHYLLPPRIIMKIR
jgi:hypothetical protein